MVTRKTKAAPKTDNGDIEVKKAKAASKANSVAVTDVSIRKAAARLLPVGAIVSVEVQYLLRTLSSSVSTEELDESILAVRKLPWARIALTD